VEEEKATFRSQTKEDRWYPGGFFEEVYSLLENSRCQTDLNSWWSRHVLSACVDPESVTCSVCE